MNFGDTPILPAEVEPFESAPSHFIDFVQPVIVGCDEPTRTQTRRLRCQNDLPVDAETDAFCEHEVYVDPDLLVPRVFPIQHAVVLCRDCYESLNERETEPPSLT